MVGVEGLDVEQYADGAVAVVAVEEYHPDMKCIFAYLVHNEG